MKQCYPKKLLLFLMLYIISAKAIAEIYAWKNVKIRRPRFIVVFLLILFCSSQTKLIAQTFGNGICFVVFDPSRVSGGVTQTIYIGVSRTGDNNIYKSTDGGSTFTAIQPDNSFMPHRAVLSPDNSTLYVVMADAEGPWNPSSGRVYKLATATDLDQHYSKWE